MTTSGWDDRILATQSAPHFMQGSAWRAVRSSSWRSIAVDLPTAGGDLAAVAYDRDAEGFGGLRHLPRVSGIAPADVPVVTAELALTSGSAFATKLELYQPRDPRLDDAFVAAGWLPSRASQYRFGVRVDLGDDDAMLGMMRKRARYEIRAAERAGVVVERVDPRREFRAELHALVRETAMRSDAFFRSDAYRDATWDAYLAEDRGRAMVARYDGEIVAFAFVITFGRLAWYKDGGSGRAHPHLFASRLLHWRIMQELAADGFAAYDLGHVPPPAEPDAPGRGILTFKSAFTTEVVEYQPSYQLAHDPLAETWRRSESAFIEAYRDRTGDYWY